MTVLAKRSFWTETAERALKTVAQTAVALVGAEAFNVLTADWAEIGAVAAGAGVVSVLTSLGSIPVGEEDSPSAI